MVAKLSKRGLTLHVFWDPDLHVPLFLVSGLTTEQCFITTRVTRRVRLSNIFNKSLVYWTVNCELRTVRFFVRADRAL